MEIHCVTGSFDVLESNDKLAFGVQYVLSTDGTDALRFRHGTRVFQKTAPVKVVFAAQFKVFDEEWLVPGGFGIRRLSRQMGQLSSVITGCVVGHKGGSISSEQTM